MLGNAPCTFGRYVNSKREKSKQTQKEIDVNKE
jgi:hypothetical protein